VVAQCGSGEILLGLQAFPLWPGKHRPGNTAENDTADQGRGATDRVNIANLPELLGAASGS
jgi:hypothetical protein